MNRTLALTLLLALLYLPALGSSSSGTHPDEAYYLGISAEMDAAGAWLTPTINGEPRWYKPPLLYWAERGAYGLFGRDFFGGRLPSALASIALALLTGALARRLYGEASATVATLLTATTIGFVKFGRLAMFDVPMALSFAAAAYGAWRACEEDRPAQLLWAGVGAGTSFMLKGPVGAVIVTLFAGTFVAIRRPRLLASRWLLGTFLLGAAIGVPWYAASWMVHGDRFFRFFFVDMNLDRFRHPWTLAGEGTLVFGLLVYLLPWTALVVGSIPAPRRWRDPGLLLPLLWTAAVLLVFSIPALKWPHYGLACLPAVALLASRAAPSRLAATATAAILGALALASGALLVFRLPLAATVALAGTLVALSAAAVLVLRRRVAASAVAVAIGFTLIAGIAVPVVNPPVLPSSVAVQLPGRDVYLDGPGYMQGLFSVAAHHRVQWIPDADVPKVLHAGGVVILAATELHHVPSELRTRIVSIGSWQRIRGYLSADELVRSWLRRDASPLYERVLAIELPLPAARGPM